MMCNKVPKNGQHPPICMFILMNKVYIDQKGKKTIQNIYDAFKKFTGPFMKKIYDAA